MTLGFLAGGSGGGEGEGGGGGAPLLLQAEDSPTLDVDRSGFVVPLDALVIINHLNSAGPGPVQPSTEHLDVNKDGWVTPIDVLVVFNYLNSGQTFVTMQLAVTGPDFSSPSEAFVSWGLAPAVRNLQVIAYRWRVVASSSSTAWTQQAASSIRFTPQTLAAGPVTLEIQAQHLETYWSGTVRHRFVADWSPPSAPVVTDDGAATSSTSQLHAVWSSADPESGIAEYQYQITQDSVSGPPIAGWTSAGSQTSVTATGLTLAMGKSYFFAVRARNGAGTYSSPGYSDGITVHDSTPPSVPMVTDDGDYTTSVNQLHAAWSSSDPESGIAEYRYQIIQREGRRNFVDTVIVDWTSAGTSTGITRTGLFLAEGKKYLFVVEARNGSGVWSQAGAGVSDGIIVDSVSPIAPFITDDGAYTSSGTELHAKWYSGDAVSGLSEYQYAIGTTPKNTGIAGWTSVEFNRGVPMAEVVHTGLSLREGVRCYFSVKARDHAGLWSPVGASDGITVDLSPPSVPAVTDDGDQTMDRTALHARWSAADAVSGVVEYQYRITEGTPDGLVVIDWTSAALNTEVRLLGLSPLKEGTPYFFSVKAKNGAGFWSAAGASDGIRVINGAPLLEPIGDKRVRLTPPAPAPEGEVPPSLPSAAGNRFFSGRDARASGKPGEQVLLMKMTPAAASRIGGYVTAGQRLRQKGHPAHLSRILRRAASARGLTMEELCCRHDARSAARLLPRKGRKPDPVGLDRIFRVKVSRREGSFSQAVAEFSGNAQVVYCQPPMKFQLFQTPNDPYLASSGSWGQSYPDLWGLKRMKAEEAWDVTAGSPEIVVAVIDTGIDPDHPDLFPNIWTNSREVPFNGRDDDGNGYVDDTLGWDFVWWDDGATDRDPRDGHGHGTHVAGTVAAVGDNGQGITGVAWKCRVMPIKGLSDDGIGFDDALASAIQYAVENGARVINMSWGAEGPSSNVMEDAIRYAYFNNVVLVAAAGNSDADAAGFTPAGLREVIAVAASDPADHRCSFSNYGSKIDVAAPGGGSTDPLDTNKTYNNILSCRSRGTDMYGDGKNVLGQYIRARGTSMASPHVAGLCALILSRHPEFTNEEVRQVLRSTADDVLDPLNDGTSYPGPDIYTGAGRVNASRAVRVDSIPVSFISAPAEWASVTGPVDVIGSASSTQGFLRYRLETGAGLNPSEWRLVRESVSPVKNGFLGTWVPAKEDLPGPFQIRLSVFVEGLPQPVERSVLVQVLPPMLPGWPKPGDHLGLSEYSQITLADLDGDERQEVLNSTGVRQDIEGNVVSRPMFDGFLKSVEDLTGDGLPEMVLLGSEGRLAVLNMDGTIRPGWPVVAGVVFGEPILTGDLDGDGLPEMVFQRDSSSGGQPRTTVYALRGDGTALAGWPKQIQRVYLANGLALVDFDGNGAKEVVVALSSSSPFVLEQPVEFYTGAGELLARWNWPPDLMDQFRALAAADLDGDGDEELVGTTGSGPTFAWGAPGQLLPGWPVGAGFMRGGGPQTLADLDGDGKLELLACGGVDADEVGAWDTRGLPVPGWPTHTSGLSAAVSYGMAQIRMVNLERDLPPEILLFSLPDVLGRETSGSLAAFRGDGTPLPGWPVHLKQWGVSQILPEPLFFDQDGDGTTEIGLMGSSRGNFSGSSQLWVLDKEGQPVPGWPIGVDGLSYFPFVTDLDGNGDQEFLMRVALRGVGVNWWAFDLPRAAGVPSPESKLYPVTRPLGQTPPQAAIRVYSRALVNGERGYLEIQLRARDPNRDRLTFSVEGLPAGAIFRPAQGFFLWRPSASQAGSYRVTFRASDGARTTSETVTIAVAPNSGGPRFSSLTMEHSVREGELLEFTPAAGDPDGDSIYFIGKDLPAGAELDRMTGRFSWRPNFAQAGEYLFLLAVTDGSLEDRRAVRVMVGNVNRPPTVTLPAAVTLKEGEILDFNLDAIDPDSQPMSFVTVSGLPPGATLSPETGLFSWQPDFTQSGSYGPVRVTVSDGELSVTREMSISVQNAQPWITPPPGVVLDGLPPATNQRTLTINGSKPAYTSILVNGQEVAARDRSTTWTATVALSEGNNALTIQTRDAAGLLGFAVSEEVLLDTVPPAVAVTSPPPGQVISLRGERKGGG